MRPLSIRKQGTFGDQIIDLIKQYINLNISTAFLAEITNVSQQQARVDVKSVGGTMNGENVLQYEEVLNVPIATIGGSVWQISYPVKVGDYGLCIVCKEDITNFFITGTAGEVATERTFNSGQSIFLPLSLYYQPVSTDDIEIISENAQLYLKPDGTVKVVSEKIEFGKGTLEKAMKGETFMKIFNEHVHTGNFGAPTSPPQTPMLDTDLSQEVKNA